MHASGKNMLTSVYILADLLHIEQYVPELVFMFGTKFTLCSYKELTMDLHNALICMPDINGYTEFMSETRMNLSTRVIPALLNEIIYSNNIGLKVSEIEGDAVLFYKLGSVPPLNRLLEQCRLFHTQFHDRLEKLEIEYDHHNGSENISRLLGLKMILHYGEVSLTRIGKRIKLLGEDVIIAHKLLKNSIDCEEYILLSDQLIKAGDEAAFKSPTDVTILFEQGVDSYGHLDPLHYHYIKLHS